jgi:hypothetical protein
MQLDVKRLSELRSKKEGATPVKQPLAQLTPLKMDSNGSRTDLYKNALLLREANKISQYLKKDTVSVQLADVCMHSGLEKSHFDAVAEEIRGRVVRMFIRGGVVRTFSPGSCPDTRSCVHHCSLIVCDSCT